MGMVFAAKLAERRGLLPRVNRQAIEELIKAMPDVWQEFPSAKLFLAGETRPSFTPALKECFAQLTDEQKKNIIHVEYFNEYAKKDLFAGIDILVMASEIDCFGIVYLEAWLSGKPVVACKNTAQETIIDDGVNGSLVEYGNVRDLASALKKLLKDKPLRDKMGEAGRRKVRSTYNLDTYAQVVCDGYHQMVKGNRK